MFPFIYCNLTSVMGPTCVLSKVWSLVQWLCHCMFLLSYVEPSSTTGNFYHSIVPRDPLRGSFVQIWLREIAQGHKNHSPHYCWLQGKLYQAVITELWWPNLRFSEKWPVGACVATYNTGNYPTSMFVFIHHLSHGGWCLNCIPLQ